MTAPAQMSPAQMSPGKGRQAYALPSDFPLFASIARNRWLSRHYGVSMSVITIWRRRTGIKGDHGSRAARPYARKEMPADFAQVAPGKVLSALGRHYGVDTKVILRWLDETGIERTPRAAKKPRPPKPHVPRKRRVFTYSGPKVKTVIPPADHSLHGDAAQYLRRFAAVYHCRESGLADPNGGFFRYGNIVLTPDELLERATRKGWKWAP